MESREKFFEELKKDLEFRVNEAKDYLKDKDDWFVIDYLAKEIEYSKYMNLYLGLASRNGETFHEVFIKIVVKEILPTLKPSGLSLKDIFSFEKIVIKENTHYVIEVQKVLPETIDINNFCAGSYLTKVEDPQFEYDTAEVDYDVYKDGEAIMLCASDSEVEEFIKNLCKKYKKEK